MDCIWTESNYFKNYIYEATVSLNAEWIFNNDDDSLKFLGVITVLWFS